MGYDYCYVCGKKVNKDMIFCPYCGEKFRKLGEDEVSLGYSNLNQQGNNESIEEVVESEISENDEKFMIFDEIEEIDKSEKICQSNFSNVEYDTTQYWNRSNNSTKKNNDMIMIAFEVAAWILFLPVMICVKIGKSNKIESQKKTRYILLIILASIIVYPMAYVGLRDGGNSNDSKNHEVNNEENTKEVVPTKEPELFEEEFNDEDLRIDFLKACDEIGIEIEEIKNFEQIDDWASGYRYKFSYEGISLLLYCNMNSTVESINLSGNGTQVYLRGYEPYKISDYVIDSAVETNLQLLTKEYVKSTLNYPDTAKFPWLDWAFGRERDLYYVESHVTAQNSFGVEDTLDFMFVYRINEESNELVYAYIDDNVVVDEITDEVEEPRAEVKIDADIYDREGINIVEGSLGEYGEIVTLDGVDYIDYYIPVGTYQVVNNGIWAKVYLSKDEYYKNSSGYMENEIVQTLDFTENGEVIELEVVEGTHVELTLNANVTFISMQ